MDADAASQPDDDATFEDLLPIVRRGLESSDHLALLGLASATLAVLLHPVEPTRAAAPDDASERVLEQVVLRYVDHGGPEALAYAVTMTAMLAPGALRSRLRAALDGAGDQLPQWLATIDDSRLEAPTIVRDLFDDDEWLVAGVHLVDGGRVSFRVSIDHGVEGAVVDAALIDQPVEEVRSRLRASAPEDEVTLTDVESHRLAERYAEAVAVDAGEPVRTGTWPSSRPLIEWALRLGAATESDARER